MSTHSIDGREWAKLSEIKEGDKLQVDADFTCMEDGDVKLVKKRKDGFYVECNEKIHLLDSQLSHEDHDHLVGMWKVNDE